MPPAPTITRRVRAYVLDQPATLGDGDCEALRPGLLGQPVNTVTSLAHVVAGCWLATRVPQVRPGDRAVAATYAGLVALTGVGSVAYHGPQFPGAQTLHDTPILAAGVVGSSVPLGRVRARRRPVPGWSPRLAAAFPATVAVAAASYRAGRTDSRWCRPRSLLQPHGLWHLCTAALLAMWGVALWPVDPVETDPIPPATLAGTVDGAR
jgi:hypothetical protein